MSGLVSDLREDIRQLALVKGHRSVSAGVVVDVLALPGFWSGTLWRVANRLHHGGLRPLSRLAYFANMVLFGADLPAGAVVGPGLVMPHPVGVAMAGDIVLGARCRVMGGVRIGGSGDPGRPGHAVIGDDVWLMDGAKVFGPVHVGDRSIVGTSALVTTDVPPDMFVHGPRRSDSMRPLTELGLADHAAASMPRAG